MLTSQAASLEVDFGEGDYVSYYDADDSEDDELSALPILRTNAELRRRYA